MPVGADVSDQLVVDTLLVHDLPADGAVDLGLVGHRVLERTVRAAESSTWTTLWVLTLAPIDCPALAVRAVAAVDQPDGQFDRSHEERKDAPKDANGSREDQRDHEDREERAEATLAP